MNTKPRIGCCVRCRRTLSIYSRRLCQTCHNYCGRHDLLADYPTVLRCRDDILDEWIVLRARELTWAEAAVEMGMKPASFDRAMWRAIKDGDPRALKPLVDRRNRSRKRAPTNERISA